MEGELRLSLKKKWFEMSKEVKKEDYREITPYWANRFLTYNNGIPLRTTKAEWIPYAVETKQLMFKDFDTNVMTLGYPKTGDAERILRFEHKGIEIRTGKAFKHNYKITDGELARYRQAVGTIPHPIWGKCTLLEIWGGDHIGEYREMVIGAFKYGAGLIKNCPPIKVHVNPLFQNSKSGEFKITEEEREEQEYQEILMAKALFYGVNEPKKRKR